MTDGPALRPEDDADLDAVHHVLTGAFGAEEGRRIVAVLADLRQDQDLRDPLLARIEAANDT